jgi:hypothetical protein
VLVAVVVTTAVLPGRAGRRGLADGSRHGQWRSVFDGYGRTSMHGGTVYLDPAPSRRPSVTHASLMVSVAAFGDVDYRLRVKTIAQLRRPRPNAWEVGWVIWHYTDPQHFYYLALKPNGWELGQENPAYPGAQRFLLTGSSPRFPPGRWHTVRIQQSSDAVRVTVDSTLLATYRDTANPYRHGSVGVYAEDARVAFRDVKATGSGPARVG